MMREFIDHHPHLTNWIGLALGMVIILLLAAKDVSLLPSQRLWMVIATIGLAGLCVWILHWEE